MKVREPIVAGRFYPAFDDECIREINQCISESRDLSDISEPIIAGIVPHAGWFFSGSLAAEVFRSAVVIGEPVDTFVLLGACHSAVSNGFDVYNGDGWETPLGIAPVNRELSELIANSCHNAGFNNESHQYEHSIEVQVPFIRYISEKSRIVAVSVPPVSGAGSFGESLADVLSGYTAGRVVVAASSDLTHYGNSYGFTPAGDSPEGIRWASEVNDKKLIDLVISMDAEGVLDHAAKMQAACGAGAIAAAIGFAVKAGRKKACLLTQTNSASIMRKKMNRESSDSVGYASIIF